MDINQKSIEKGPYSSRPKHNAGKQLPERKKNPRDDGLLSENEEKISKEHAEEKEALIIACVSLIISDSLIHF